MAGPLDFWRIVKEINPAAIREEAETAFVVAAVAAPEDGTALRRAMGMDTQALRDRAGGRWREVALPLGDAARGVLEAATMAVSLSAIASPHPQTWILDPADRQALADDLADMLDRHEDLTLALPRYIPAFRRIAATRIINRTARTNAEVALVSALPGVIPWTAVLLPVTSLPDMALLTKNQVMMALKLAAAYGLEVEPKERLAELGGTIGAAFGWRALAREAVGVVPGGVGAIAKAAVAYAGTVATGRAIQAFYETGRHPTDRQVRAWFKAAMWRGRDTAREAWDRARRKPEPEPEPA
jgi:uncharacterized protein (DUF697 family)